MLLTKEDLENKMNHYPENEYPNLYNEIIKEHNFRYGKWSPIPYPKVTIKETNPTPLLPKPIRKLPQWKITILPNNYNNKQSQLWNM